MDYIDKNLEKNEKVLAKAKINWFIIVLPLIFLIIWEILAYGVGLFNVYTEEEFWEYTMEHNELPNGYHELDVYEQVFYGAYFSHILFGTAYFGTFEVIIIRILVQLIAFLPFIINLSVFLTNKLAVTNNRVMGKVGIFSITAIDFPIQNVETVMLKATFWGRIFHFYTLSIRGTGGSKRTIKCVSNANEVKNAVTLALKRHADDARKLQAMEIAAALAPKTQAMPAFHP